MTDSPQESNDFVNFSDSLMGNPTAVDPFSLDASSDSSSIALIALVPPRMKFRQGKSTNNFTNSDVLKNTPDPTNQTIQTIFSGETLSTESDTLLVSPSLVSASNSSRAGSSKPSSASSASSASSSSDLEAQANTVFSPIFDDSKGSPADKRNIKSTPTPLPDKPRTGSAPKSRSRSEDSKKMASFMRSSGLRPAQVSPGASSGAPGENAAQGEGPDFIPASGPVYGADDRFQDNPRNPRYLVSTGPSVLSKISLKIHQWYVSFTGMMNSWVESAAGYDEKIIESFGTPTDEKRRRNIGRAIVVATLVGSLGWLVKISLAMPAPYGIIVGLIISGLYGVLSYSLESFFAANVNPFAPLWSKCLSLLGRSLLSALIAFSGALPWVTMSLKGSIHLEMAKIAQTEQLSMRENIDKLHGLTGLGARSTALQSELAQWNDSVANLPASVASVFAQADQCDAQSIVLKQDVVKREADFSSRLGALSKQESSARGDARKINGIINAINSERKTISKRVADLDKSLVDQKSQCTAFHVSANEARDEHVKMASAQRQSAMARLSKQRDNEQTELSVAQQDTVQADKVTKLALSENSAGEFTALVSLIKNQFYAQFLGLLIFMGLFMVDVLPLTLRLFARPGPYDVEKRADDAIRMMRAEGRQMQAELIHSARQTEIASQEFRKQVQDEVRPHIRSIALNDVSRFVAKQRNVA